MTSKGICMNSVVDPVPDPDPNPVGSKPSSRVRIRIRIRKKLYRIRIRAAPDQKWIEVKLLWKTDKIWQFLNKNAQLKNFSVKKISPKNLYLVTMSNLAHLQDGNTNVKFMSRILEKIHVGSDKNEKSFRTGSTTLYMRVDNCSIPVPVLLILGDPMSCCGVPAVDSRRVRGKKAHRRIGMALHRSQGLSHLYQIIITGLSWANVTLTLNPSPLSCPTISCLSFFLWRMRFCLC